MAVSAYKKVLAIALVFASLSLFSQSNENLEEEVANPKATTTKESTSGEAKEITEPSLAPVKSSTTTRSATIETKTESTPVGDNDQIFINSKTSFELRANDDSSMVDFIEYRINSGDLVKYTNPITLSSEGVSQITYRSVDKAGNVEPFKLLTVVVDNTAPTVVLVPQEPFYIAQGSNFAAKNNTFSFKASDELAGVEKIEYAINDSNFQTFAKDNPIQMEKEGSNLIRFTATDNAGNLSRESSIAVIIDDKAPTVEIFPMTPLVDIEGKVYSRKGNSFSVRAADAESGVRRVLVKMSGDSEFRTYVEPIVVNAGGEYTIEAKAVDNVGNESEVVSISFLVDVNPPQSEIKKIKPAE